MVAFYKRIFCCELCQDYHLHNFIFGCTFIFGNVSGVGYHMVAEKVPGCNPEAVLSFLSRYVPGVEKESDIGAELTFRLPQESSPNFPSAYFKFASFTFKTHSSHRFDSI